MDGIFALAVVTVTVLLGLLAYFGPRSFRRYQDRKRVLLTLRVLVDCLNQMSKKWLKGEKEHVIENKHFEYEEIRHEFESRDLFKELEEVRRRLRKEKNENADAIVTPQFIKSIYQEREAFGNILRRYPKSKELVRKIDDITFALLKSYDFPKPDSEIRKLIED